MSSNETDGKAAVVLLTGSQNIMAGFAGDEVPRAVFPNCVAHDRPGLGNKMFGMSNAPLVGDAAHTFKGLCTLKYPMKRGIVQDWEEQERVWQHTLYNELHCEPEEVWCCMSRHLAEPREQTEKTVQIMFEKFEVPRLYLVDTGMSALYATGHTCGVVVDCGHGRVQITPFHEGVELRYAAVSLPYGGDDVTGYLQRLMNSRASRIWFRSTADREIVRAIKEKVSYVALDFQAELDASNAETAVYDLPGWEQVHVGAERFEAPELLFKPYLIGSQSPGIHEAVHAAITRCELDLRIDLWANIFVVGGVSTTPGLRERLEKELLALVPQRLQDNPGRLRVKAVDDRVYSSWIGMSIVGALSSYRDEYYKDAWLTKQQYEEGGSQYHAFLSG